MKEFREEKKWKTNRPYQRHGLKNSWNSNVSTKWFSLAHFPVDSCNMVFCWKCNDGDRANAFNNKSFRYRYIHTLAPAASEFSCVSHTNTLFYWHETSATSKITTTWEERATQTIETIEWIISFKWRKRTQPVFKGVNNLGSTFWMHETSTSHSSCTIENFASKNKKLYIWAIRISTLSLTE